MVGSATVSYTHLIQQFYNELLKSGRVQKKNQPELREHGLSPRMVQSVSYTHLDVYKRQCYLLDYRTETGTGFSAMF